MNLDFYDGAFRRRLSAVAYELTNMVHSLGARDRSRNESETAAERARRKVAIRQRINAELNKGGGTTLPLLKAEFERDLNGILAELQAWQQRLEARSQERRPH